jgi:hypothetical protein
VALPPLFDNARKLRALLSELQELTLQIIDADSRQQGQEPETQGPDNVANARLTCGRQAALAPLAQVTPKRETSPFFVFPVR